MVATRSPTLKPVTPSDRLDYPRADASNIQIISPLDDLALLRPTSNIGLSGEVCRTGFYPTRSPHRRTGRPEGRHRSSMRIA